MRRVWFAAGVAPFVLLAMACDDDEPSITDPVIRDTNDYTLDIRQAIVQATDKPGELVVVPTHRLGATDAVQPDTLRDVLVTFPDEDVDFALADFERVDGAWTMVFEGTERDAPMPEGTYMTRLRVRSFDGWTFASEQSLDPLEMIGEPLIMSEDGTEVSVTWLPPSAPHAWQVGVYRRVEGEEDDAFELVTEGPGGDSDGGEPALQRAVLSLAGLDEGDTWVVLVIVEGERTTRTVEATEANFTLEVGQTIHQTTDEPERLAVVPKLRLTSVDAARPDTLQDVTVVFPDGSVLAVDPAFEMIDTVWTLEFDGPETDALAPDGTYDVQLRFPSFGGWTFAADQDPDGLETSAEPLEVDEDRTEATLTWTPPDDEHTWATGLYRVNGAGDLELVAEGPAGESEDGGDGDPVEVVLPLDGLAQGDTWLVRLTVEGGLTTRIIDATEHDEPGDDEAEDTNPEG